ncbi:hypothetical protein EI94DRAFT_154601 [Lactarius quietus]|nr:hypothetical protein EI94DRAFT_1632091 [Lactarius quietus]KAF8257425.1 hypothetical protein EI94DRAFT_1630731 [Lactarius quietus]KAF8272747.1 hypothetical protein EI94DRAFT_154601 [Lactarius quietus]
MERHHQLDHQCLCRHPVIRAQVSLLASSVLPLSAPAQPTEDEPDEIRAIWGTTVNLADTMKTFREFINCFKPKYRVAHDRSVGLPTKAVASPVAVEVLLYENYLRRMRLTGEANLNLDCKNLCSFPPSRKLYGQLVKYPQEVIPAMDQVLKDIMLELAEEDQAEGVEGMTGQEGEEEIAEIMSKVYKVRPFGLPAVNMCSLNPQDTDKLVCIKGLVIRATPVIPDMKVAFFRCLTFNHTVQVEIDRSKIDEPAACSRDVCTLVGTMSLVHNRCEFADRQVIRLQETPDAVPDGQTPHTVSLSAYDELVDVSKPGDRLVVTGMFCSVPVCVNPQEPLQNLLGYRARQAGAGPARVRQVDPTSGWRPPAWRRQWRRRGGAGRRGGPDCAQGRDGAAGEGAQREARHIRNLITHCEVILV